MNRLPWRPLQLALVLLAGTMGAPVLALDPPGSSRDPTLTSALEAAYTGKGEDYTPRTRHLDTQGRARYVNRLIREASPYLLQHAHNPVDWRPWGEEALAEAAALDRPIFLSIGYSTCHWCHVMEEESFEDEAVATLLNASFIPIKVDREQSPAVDHVYIMATQLQRGHAGWPNSVWLTPAGKPFFTGVYFPRERFVQILRGVRDRWKSDHRAQLLAYADRFAQALRDYSVASRAGPLDQEVFRRAVRDLAGRHNELEGGFSDTTQFPQESYLLFLLDHWRRTGQLEAREMVLRTLHAIAGGGIHDQVGGGFHRYAVDPGWRIPHFEKMLYNQALLSRAYVEAWQIDGDPTFSRAARRAFDYVLRDMRTPDGMFYAAEDADSRNAHGEIAEGAFYVWPGDSVGTALGADAAWASRTLGLNEPGEPEIGPVAHLPDAAGADFARLDPLLETLQHVRARRARPLRDQKVIAGWNGLMIRALAEGGVALRRPDYVEAAVAAANAILAKLWNDATLRRLYVDGRALEAATLRDYAWFGLGLVALHDATGKQRWLTTAEQISDAIEARFADARGRLKMAQADGPLGPVYSEEDNNLPSGESSALELFVRLDGRTLSPEHRRRAGTLLSAISGGMSRIPTLRTSGLVGARILEDGESTLARPVGRGAARVQVHRQPGGFELSISFQEGWHANAHEPGAEDLIGAALEGATIDWPAGVPLETRFSSTPIRVYEGTLVLPLGEVEPDLALTLQICSTELCLPPETARFRLGG